MHQMLAEDYYELSKEEQNQYHTFIENKILNDKENNPILFGMLLRAQIKIEDFKSDFYVRDFNTLTIHQTNCKRFLWNIDDSSSHLIQLDNMFSDEMDENYDIRFNLKSNLHFKNSKTYLIDLDTNSLTRMNPDDINDSFFVCHYTNASDAYKTKKVG